MNNLEQFYLFLPSTTGLNKPKKSKPFDSFDDALNAGYALNLLEGRKDRLFVIISSSQLRTFTQLTGELPFSESFFRYNRLSDGADKFLPQNQSLRISSTEIDLDYIPQKYEPLLLNPKHPSLLCSPEEKAKSLSDRLLEHGLSKENIHRVQNLIQSELNLVPLDHQKDETELNLRIILEDHFEGLDKANLYIYNLITSKLDFSQVSPISGELLEKE